MEARATLVKGASAGTGRKPFRGRVRREAFIKYAGYAPQGAAKSLVIRFFQSVCLKARGMRRSPHRDVVGFTITEFNDVERRRLEMSSPYRMLFDKVGHLTHVFV